MIEMEERINKVLKVLEDIYKKNIEVKFKTLKNKNRNDCLINILILITLMIFVFLKISDKTDFIIVSLFLLVVKYFFFLNLLQSYTPIQ